MVAPSILFPLLLMACSQAGASTAGLKPQQRQDSVATAVIPPEGGTVELQGVGRVIFPAGTFETPQPVKVWTTDYPGTEGGQADFFMVGAGPPPPSSPWLRQEGHEYPPPALPYDIRISGDAPPATEFEVALVVPDSYLSTLPSDQPPRIFVDVETGGRMETHSEYSDDRPSRFDPVTKLLHGRVGREAHWLRRDGGFNVSIIIAGRGR